MDNEGEFAAQLSRPFVLFRPRGGANVHRRARCLIDAKPHPAELSGASSDSKLRLMGIPYEVRAKIFHHILVNTVPIVLKISCKAFDTGSKEWRSHLEHEEERGFQCRPRSVLTDISPKDIKALLQVSRQVHEEGNEMLFGQNSWSCDSGQWFEKYFITDPYFGIGTKNAGFIQDLLLELPLALEGDTEPPFRSVATFVDFICTNLPDLRSLGLYLRTSQWLFRWVRDSAGNQPILNTAIERRALCIVSRITEKHQTLKKAIWTAEKSGRLFVTIVPSRREDSVEATAICDDNDGSPNVAVQASGKDFILDCAKIRKYNWYELFGQKASQFALPDSAVSSEPPTVALDTEGDGLDAALDLPGSMDLVLHTETKRRNSV
ncbi:hypothetical protein H2200_007217 [Cladophialophora chaetospira]|uniref:F-box domain-containing protein n=1 Tax=Cladophialophora chaetospira TaxID=386627 RepID=A0AA38X7H8_9EURO|nr:hypothetical protein H2200_007217 [Cladophialophora chaetospira]